MMVSSWQLHAWYAPRHASTCTHKLLNPNQFLPAKAVLFAHPFEIHEGIMLDVCRPELH